MALSSLSYGFLDLSELQIIKLDSETVKADDPLKLIFLQFLIY